MLNPRLALLALGLTWSMGCTLLLKPLDGSRDADTSNSETGPDADDGGQAPDADHDRIDEPGDADVSETSCPMNSGDFCTCDSPWSSTCSEDTYCITVRNLGDAGTLGFCAPLCDCASNDSCEPSPFNATSKCILMSDWPLTSRTICSCVLTDCEDASDCPPGQRCREIVGTHGDYEGVRVNICSP
jgi:hypothetical protein